MYADAKKVTAAAVAAGGSGYAAGDYVTVASGTQLADRAGSQAAVLLVTAVDGSGAVTALSVASPGRYFAAPSATDSPTGGTGSGLSATLTTALLWDSSEWVVLSWSALSRVVDWATLRDANQNTAEGTDPVNETDESAGNRASECLADAVAELRSRVNQGGKVPLSLTAGSVPPMAVRHVLYYAAYALVGGRSTLAQKLLMDMKGESPLAVGYRRAEKFYVDILKGLNVDYPSDPDPTWQPGVVSGSNVPAADLTTSSAPSGFGSDTANLGQP